MKLALVGLLAAALGGTAAAQSNAVAETPPPGTGRVPAAQIVISGWRYQCDSSTGAFACQVTDVVGVRGSDAVVAAVRIRVATENKTPIVAVQVPLGIAVAHGVRAGFENGAMQTLPIFTCDRRGCFATAELGGPMLAAMRGAKSPLRIAYETLNGSNEQTISVQLGMADFPAAYDQLRK
ncbi:MAG TPA: invasion associated locus B family protein [Candidatus Baltobacteraceae bacterium]|nr:invasion associated locus B family protein [Candidatus Baltobacteraceae bacterium]